MNTVQVWYLVSARWDGSDYAPFVTEHERLRAERFRFGNDAGRFMASRALLRAAVGHHLSVSPGSLVFHRRCSNCGSSDHGRPTVRVPVGSAPSVDFSLTRAGPVVAVAIGSGPLGLDAEPMRAGMEQLIDGPVFSADERSWIRDVPPSAMPLRVLRLWVAKEAVGKASGLGLRHAERVLVPLDRDGWRRAADAAGQGCWLTELDIPGAAAAALAARAAPPAEVRVADARALDLPAR